jgi:hypothetical protein
MDFDFNINELNGSFLQKIIHSFRIQNRGDFPTRIVINYKGFDLLIDEARKLSGFNATSDFKIFGVKIIRTPDLPDYIIELY